MTIPYPAFLKGLAERTDVDKTFSDSILPSKSTDLFTRKYFTRNKTAALLEGFPTPTASSRNVDKTFSDSVLPSKTTNLSQVNYPKDLAGSLDETTCNGSVSFDLTWDVGTYTSWTMTLERRDISTWYTVSSSISAGTESYRDNNATPDDTNRYRIKFNITGAAWTEQAVNSTCPT